jgi:hypothetical protein
VEDPAPRDVGEVPGARCAESLRHHLIEEEIEELVDRPAVLGQRLDERARELDAAVRVRGGLGGQRLDVGGHALDRRVDESAQRPARELELPVLGHAIDCQLSGAPAGGVHAGNGITR